ncbi:UvrD-helicase domain-containing protein [Janthinobacterium aquaticum]|uniref:UvrD-helicase domain-containing protein n=1 Tax=Janthinobacterium sp. FT58W TaxID=2654254 RepID=UPI001264336E|nr:ATP-dependent helicase [Janthinobacterium sp. FT58W]KAB8042667.1 AAA family ATPase [Janthinobacterium sp. FT58W]
MNHDNAAQFTPKRITPTQEQLAIQTAQKKIIVIDANAGAAKTTTLALRLAEALHRGRPPERMLALVFTEAARVALRQRLLDIGVPLGVVKRLTIDTFDSFAGKALLQFEHAPVAALRNNEALLPMVREALEITADKYGHRHVLEINTTNAAMAEFLKLQLRTKARLDFARPEMDSNSLDDNLELLGMSRTHYLWLREYESLRGAEAGEIQFRGPFDATYDLVRLLADDEPLRQLLPAYQIIVADELHDLNEASFRLLTMLIRRGNAFFCGAGDKDQVIYTWSGADHRFLRQRFEQEFPALQRLPLTASYRYGPQLARAVGVLKNKPSVSALTRATVIELLPYDHAQPQACSAQLIAALEDAGAAGSGGTAILLRDRDQAIRVETALFQSGIAYGLVDMNSYLLSQEVLMLRGMVAMARKDLHAIPAGPRRGEILEALVAFAEIPFTQSELQQAKADVANYPDLLEGFLSNQLARSSNRDRAALTQAAVDYLRGLPATAPAGPALQHIFVLLGLEQTARRIHVDPAQARVVARALHGFIAVCSEAQVTLDEFSGWLGEMEEAVSVTSGKAKLVIACIDQIKGLEYQHVILPYLAIDEFPRSQSDALEEENRFYVAATRARERLTLLMPENPAYQSRYIAALQAALG